MYKVKLTTESYYQKIKSFKVWDADQDYFIFYWADGTNIVIKKEYVISIQKYT